jgi:hypothetical protein
MQTQCNAEQLKFSCVERRRVVAAFDGGTVSSDAGALLLGRADEAIGLIDRLARSFIDERRGLDRAYGQDADRTEGIWDGARI